MSNDLIMFEGGSLPSYMQSAIDSGEVERNLQQRNSINQLTFRGKVWRAIIEGDEKVVMNEDGDPKSTIHVVILNQNPARSRSYYEGQYKEGENRMPTCYSSDGITPDSEVEKPCGTTCASCPMAAKGSRINADGSPGVACSTFKNLAVIPADDLEFPAMRLRLPQTSIWDKETEGQEWMAFDQYMNKLRGAGLPNSALVVTKVKFDTSKAYPKLLFALDMTHSPKYKALLSELEFSTVSKRLKEDFGVLLGTKRADGSTPALPKPTLTPVPVLDAEPRKKAEPVAEAPEVKTNAKKSAPAPAAVQTVTEEDAKPDGLSAMLDEFDDE